MLLWAKFFQKVNAIAVFCVVFFIDSSHGIHAVLPRRRLFFHATLDGWQLVVDDRWRPPLVDEDWLAVCAAIHTGVESLYYKFVDMNKAVNVRSPGGRRKTKMHRKIGTPKKEVTRIVTNPTRRTH